MSGSVIVGGARTPIGKLSGALAPLSAVELGGLAIRAALERALVEPTVVDYVVMGQVLGAGQGQITARQAAVRAGIPMEVPATTVNKVCLSGLNAIHLADLMIRSGEAEIVVAGGMESMTGAPHLLPGARAGYRYGSREVLDAILTDGLLCSFEHCAMGEATDRDSAVAGLSRERQDELSALSHARAAAAIKEGRFDAEIVPVEVPQRRGAAIVVDTDEGVRADTSVATLQSLRPAFAAEGTITAGNASQISDGGAAVVVMGSARAAALGLTPLAEIVGYGQVAGPDASLLTQPSRAIMDALRRSRIELRDVELFEINEAFAAVVLAAMDDLGIDSSVTNVNGGAVALGHPIGMSGTRLAITMVEELRRRGGGLGAVGLCGGGGQGDAMLLKVS